MKMHLSKLALAALVVAGIIGAAAPAHAVSYYDSYGRAYYYNSWGQPVYYDTGYNAGTVYAPRYTPAAYAPAQPVYTQPSLAAVPTYTTYQAAPAYQQTTTSYSSDAPLMAAIPADNTQTTYQYYYPDGSTAQTTYVSQTSVAPVASSVCRQSSRTVKQWGEIQTRYFTECQQSDGTWTEQ